MTMSSLSKLERVLIVEDHVPLRAAIAAMARGWGGARVLEAGTAREALDLLHEAPELLIADICLPDGSVLAVLEATLDLSPEPVKIGISGGASANRPSRWRSSDRPRPALPLVDFTARSSER